MARVYARIAKITSTSVAVHIHGETGTGKDLAAGALGIAYSTLWAKLKKYGIPL